MVVGIALLVLGGPMFFLSTSWIEYVGILFVLAGGALVITTIVRS
jgi:hypothetical protein